MLKKNIGIFILMLIFLTGCRAGDSKYSRLILKDYKTSLEYKKYLEKKLETNPQYYKLKSFSRFWQEEMFFVIEDIKEEKKVNLLLAIKYRGKEWVYMSKIEFISSEVYENYTLNFEQIKYQAPIWKDNATLFMGVEERIAFKLQETEIEQVEKFINSVNLKIKLYSDYDARTYERDIRGKEKRLMKEVLTLYRSISKKYAEEKFSEESLTEKERA